MFNQGEYWSKKIDAGDLHEKLIRQGHQVQLGPGSHIVPAVKS